jgi:hypothetical protein
MKRAAVLVVCSVFFVPVGATSARAQGLKEPGVLSITFYLRAGLNDEAVLCSDHDFRDRADAYRFARALAPKLALGPGHFRYDTIDYRDCVRIFPNRGLTRAGQRPHERTFSFDGQRVLDEAKKDFQLEVLRETVCIPVLSHAVAPTPSVSNLSTYCDHPFERDDTWLSSETGSVQPIEVSFRGTPTYLLLGLLGDAAFWVMAAGLLFVIARAPKRREWRFFTGKSRFIAWPLDIVLMFVLVFAAAVIAPYWSGWIPSLQAYLHIGVPGEAVLVTLPTLGLCFAMIAGPIQGTGPHRAARTSARLADPGTTPSGMIPRLDIPNRVDARSITYFLIGLLPFLALIVLMNDVRAGLAAHVVFLTLAFLFLFGDPLWRRLKFWSGHGRDETTRLTLVRSELSGLNVHLSRAYSSRNPVLGDLWMPSAGRVTPVQLAGNSVVVWRRLWTQSPALVAGAALDSVGLRNEWIVVPFLLFAATLGEIDGRHLAHGISIAVAALASLFLIRWMATIVKRRKLIRAATRSPRAPLYLQGLLLRRWISARVVAPKKLPSSQFFARRQPSTHIWKGALKAADRFASRANIPPDRVEAIVREVMATDLG